MILSILLIEKFTNNKAKDPIINNQIHTTTVFKAR